MIQLSSQHAEMFAAWCRRQPSEVLIRLTAEMISRKILNSIILGPGLHRRLVQAVAQAPSWELARTLAMNTDALPEDHPFWDEIEVE